MYQKIKTKFFTVTICGIMTAVMLLAPGINPCADAESRRMGGSAVTNVSDNPLYPGYPEDFDSIGRLDRIADEEVVISDVLYRLSPSAAYHTPNHSNASPSRFHDGDYVGCLIDESGEIESIWLISRAER